MDDAQIRKLREQVLAELQVGPAPSSSLEARVAALENAIARLVVAPAAAVAPAAPAVTVTLAPAAPAPAHPAFQLIGPSACTSYCILEPDKPCTGSGTCRTFGH